MSDSTPDYAVLRCEFGCGPYPDDGPMVGGAGFVLVPACPVHGWFCGVLDAAAEREASLIAERDEAREDYEEALRALDGRTEAGNREIARVQAARVRAETALRDVKLWFDTRPWEGTPDGSSHGGGTRGYSDNERKLGYGTYRDPRHLPAALAVSSASETETERSEGLPPAAEARVAVLEAKLAKARRAEARAVRGCQVLKQRAVRAETALRELADEAASAVCEPRRFHENTDGGQQRLGQAVAHARSLLAVSSASEAETSSRPDPAVTGARRHAQPSAADQGGNPPPGSEPPYILRVPPGTLGDLDAMTNDEIAAKVREITSAPAPGLPSTQKEKP